jgi:hypothetical protein
MEDIHNRAAAAKWQPQLIATAQAVCVTQCARVAGMLQNGGPATDWPH